MDRRRSARTLFGLLVLLLFSVAPVPRGGVGCVKVTEVRLSTVDVRPYVVQGESATLVCQYLLDPSEEVTEVEWEKDGSLVYLWTLGDEPEAKGVLLGRVDLAERSAATLSITRVHMDMHGSYTCRVRTNGKTAQNDMFLMVVVDACNDSSWHTHSDMINCTENFKMHCVGIFPKPSPACGVFSARTGKYLASVPFGSVDVLHNGTYEVGFDLYYAVKDWRGHPDIVFQCYMVILGTAWRSGITHKMFGDPGCEKSPPSIAHGHYNVTGDTGCWGYPAEGSSAEYHCDAGLQMHGTALHVCSRGRWVPEGVGPAEGDHPEDGLPVCGDGSGVPGCLTTCGCRMLLALSVLFHLTRIASSRAAA